MSNQILVLEDLTTETAVEVFVEKGLDPYLEMITSEARSLVPDTSTKKGRDAIASMARKVARSKTFLDGLGKELNAEAKKKAKIVDDVRKSMREYLDSIRDEVRAPLTEYEQNIKKLEAEQLDNYEHIKQLCALADLEGNRLTIDQLNNSLTELELITVDDSYGEHELKAFKAKTEGVSRITKAIEDIQKEEQEKAEQLERERLEQMEIERAQEEQRQIEIENARIEAERKAKEEAERKEAEHKAALKAQEEKAKQDAIDYQRQIALAKEAEKLAAERAEQKRIADEKAEAQRIIDQKAMIEEQKRIAAEQERNRLAQIKADEEAQAAARARNVEHKRRINLAALDALINNSGISEDQAKDIIKAIASGLIPNVSIDY